MNAPTLAAAATEGRRIRILGTVQGVGFRPWVYRLARHHGVAGSVRNDEAGVTVEAFGETPDLDAFAHALETSPPPAAAIQEISWSPLAGAGDRHFVIVESRPGGVRRLSIPPDLATCEDCRRELADPADRRFGYAFINCTNCGPRFTIAWDLPYDRSQTTMAGFALCPLCRAEYEDPGDRRYHAQPNACAACGPRLWLAAGDGQELTVPDPVEAAARALAAGLIVAVKGLGGFHLACDATDPAAVERLRRRKRRPEKPLAVMVADLQAARRLAQLSSAEAELLIRVERPVVLADLSSDATLAPGVGPGLRQVGLMLPYTPLHHLLLAAAARPLVMTSGNAAGQPMAYHNEAALTQLRQIADLFLLHNRPIARACDDSVARILGGAPALLRRSRGWVPKPVRLPRPVDRPVLACGAHLKNTFCLAVGDLAYLGPHIGDLETVEILERLEEAVADMERLLRVEPEVIAHDLHGEYLSTVYARGRQGLQVAVQHHHAHVASALAEHGLMGPVLGVAFDGVGLGTDGTAWGGEILLADAESFERLATLRPLALAGGDLAVLQPWRLALAAVDDAFGGQFSWGRLPLFKDLPASRVEAVLGLIRRRVQAPPAHGAGRWFDAVGALVLDRPVASYEGQVAIALEQAAGPVSGDADFEPYAWSLATEDQPWQIDLRPAVRTLVLDRLAGQPAGLLAGRFHATLAAATAGTLEALARQRGWAPVVLTGGCFHNRRLTEDLHRRLTHRTQVLLHRQIPAGDGGIALGQVLVADAQARRIPCA